MRDEFSLHIDPREATFLDVYLTDKDSTTVQYGDSL